MWNKIGPIKEYNLLLFKVDSKWNPLPSLCLWDLFSPQKKTPHPLVLTLLSSPQPQKTLNLCLAVSRFAYCTRFMEIPLKRASLRRLVSFRAAWDTQ